MPKVKDKKNKASLNFLNIALENLNNLNNQYNSGQSVITDQEYEVLLKSIMNEHCVDRKFIEDSYTTNIKKKNVNYITHPTLIYRVEKLYNYESIQAIFRGKLSQEINIVLEAKIDGIMINLIYNEGKLIKAITRGDKHGGEDVTTIIQSTNIPKEINMKEFVEIRGELFVFNSVYKDKYSSFSSPRAALMSLLSTINNTSYEDLTFAAHDVGSLTLFNLKASREEILTLFKTNGFLTPENKTIKLLNLNFEYEKFLDLMKIQNVPIDGLIVRINDYEERIKLDKYKDKYGSVYAIKETLSFITKVTKIDYTIGKTGKITPIIHIDPVEIESTVCTKICMYSREFFHKSKAAIGSKVSILYHGIFVFDRTLDGAEEIPELTNCLSCNNSLKVEGLHYYCLNTRCSIRLVSSITAFCNHVGVTNLSKQTITNLVENNFIKTVVDIFKLEERKEEINKLRGFKEKRLDQILQSVMKVKEEIRRCDLIYSLGIEGLGLNTCIELEKYFYEFQSINWEEINSVNVYQKKTIISFLEIQENINTLENLQKSFSNL